MLIILRRRLDKLLQGFVFDVRGCPLWHLVAWKVATELHRELGMTVCKLGGKAKKEARKGRECVELSTGAQSNAAESEKRYRRSRHWEGHGCAG